MDKTSNRLRTLAIISILVLAGTAYLLYSPDTQIPDEKTTTMSLRRDGKLLNIDISHRQYDVFWVKPDEEVFLRLMFNLDVKGAGGSFALKTIPSKSSDEGTEFNIELGKLPPTCTMGIQYIPSDAQGIAGEDMVQFAIVALLKGGAEDWTVENPKVTMNNLALEFSEDLGNQSTPLISMGVEADLLNETQYTDWMNSLNPPVNQVSASNPSVRSMTTYDSANVTDQSYEILFSVQVDDIDGLQDIASVSVLLPNGTAIPLQDEGTGLEYHPAGDGEYFTILKVGNPVTGNFTFQVIDGEGHTAENTTSLDEWPQPLDWVSPGPGEALNITTTKLVFNSSQTSLNDFTITLGNETTKFEGFWSKASNSTHLEYDGNIQLQTGAFWWTLLAESEKGNIVQAYTEFAILE